MKQAKGETLAQVMLDELEEPKDYSRRKIVISLEFKRLGFEDDWENMPGFMMSYGYFSLAFAPEENPKKPFKIHTVDATLRAQVLPNRFRDWKEFERIALSEKSRALTFLYKATTISKELFDIAYANYGARLPFVIDIVKYYNMFGSERTWFTTRTVLYGIAHTQDMKTIEQKKMMMESGYDPFGHGKLI